MLRHAELRRLAFIVASLLAAARALPVEHHHDDHGHVDHACPYDALGPEVVVRAPQQYASSRSPRRRLNATDPNAGWSALRIHVIDAVTGAGVLDAASEAFLLGTLVPSAVGWLEAALLVEPVVGTLKAARACGALWSNGVCTLEATTACGHAAAVPAELLDELTVCDDFTAASCTVVAAGAGVAADFAISITALDTTLCSSGATIAYASTCQRDQNDRPIFGFIACPPLS